MEGRGHAEHTPGPPPPSCDGTGLQPRPTCPCGQTELRHLRDGVSLWVIAEGGLVDSGGPCWPPAWLQWLWAGP